MAFFSHDASLFTVPPWILLSFPTSFILSLYIFSHSLLLSCQLERLNCFFFSFCNFIWLSSVHNYLQTARKMALGYLLTALTILPSLVSCQSPTTSSKRGLVFVPSENHPQDDANWDSPTSDLTWYYNYASKPSPALAGAPKLQFVPMLWGAGNSTTFLSDVQSQIKAGANITYVLGFNEPDGESSTYVLRSYIFRDRDFLRDGRMLTRIY